MLEEPVVCIPPVAHVKSYVKVGRVRNQCLTPGVSSGVGAPTGFVEGGVGDVGEANVCFQKMAKTMRRLGKIRDNAEADSIDVEKYLKEVAVGGHHGLRQGLRENA